MLTHFFIGIVLVTIPKLKSSYGENFWTSSSPGELLNKLDLMTIDSVQTPKFPKLQTLSTTSASTVTSTPVRKHYTTAKTVQKEPAPLPKKRVYTKEDDSSASASVESDNYEREYEQFVRNYFDDAANHYLTNDDESNESAEVENLSTDASYEADSTAPLDAVPYSSTTKSNKNQTKKCRKVRRKREICIICKNTRNGDHSETCTYKSGNEPESYAYETERKYRKTRERNDNDSEDDDEDGEPEENVAESKVNKKMIEVEKEKTETSPLKRLCIDPNGQKEVKCSKRKINDEPKKKIKTKEEKHKNR